MTAGKCAKGYILNKGLKVCSHLLRILIAVQQSVFGDWFLVLEDYIAAKTHTHMNMHINTQ